VAVDALTANAKAGKASRPGKAAKALVPGRRMPRVAISAGDGSELTVGGLLRDPRFHVLIVPEIETSATSQSQSQSLPVYLSKLVASGFDDRAAALVDSPRGTLAHLLTGRSAGPTALLVRPDGYLAARIDGVDAQSLTSALTRHLGAAGVASPQPGAQAPAVALSTAA
ncbi:MAG: hypothetical protein ACRDVE_04830, partial [Actinocrinis sp.]